MYEAPKLIVDYTSVKNNREERLKAEDTIHDMETAMHSDEGMPVQGPMAAMESVFTAVEILGHIFRNHYARLDATPKRQIFQVTTKATLRCIGDMFDHLSKNIDALVAAIRVFTDKLEEKQDEDRKQKVAQKLVFYISAAFLWYCSRQLARSLGDEHLEVTYEQALTETPEVTRRFVDLIIKLDCFKSFPLKDLQSVVEELRDNHLGTAALRFAVAERLDMRPPSKPGDLQKFCNAVGLAIKPRLMARTRR
jgi:hypothetical protein